MLDIYKIAFFSYVLSLSINIIELLFCFRHWRSCTVQSVLFSYRLILLSRFATELYQIAQFKIKKKMTTRDNNQNNKSTINQVAHVFGSSIFILIKVMLERRLITHSALFTQTQWSKFNLFVVRVRFALIENKWTIVAAVLTQTHNYHLFDLKQRRSFEYVAHIFSTTVVPQHL